MTASGESGLPQGLATAPLEVTNMSANYAVSQDTMPITSLKPPLHARGGGSCAATRRASQQDRKLDVPDRE